jgi:hypothetical protein
LHFIRLGVAYAVAHVVEVVRKAQKLEPATVTPERKISFCPFVTTVAGTTRLAPARQSHHMHSLMLMGCIHG